MKTIILIYFPEQYTYAPDRPVRFLTEPLQVYADWRFPSDEDVIPYGEKDTILIFREVVIPTSEQLIQLQKGNCKLIFEDKDEYNIESIRAYPNDLRVEITAKYSRPYVKSNFSTFTVGGDRVLAGDDTIGVNQ